MTLRPFAAGAVLTLIMSHPAEVLNVLKGVLGK